MFDLWGQEYMYPNSDMDWDHMDLNKGNNKITELRTILQRESQNS
jgi:hypothetical protein